jgi:hypothetical protein
MSQPRTKKEAPDEAGAFELVVMIFLLADRSFVDVLSSAR